MVLEEILRRKASRGWFSGEACSGDRLVWLSMLVHKPVYRWSAQLRKAGTYYVTVLKRPMISLLLSKLQLSCFCEARFVDASLRDICDHGFFN